VIAFEMYTGKRPFTGTVEEVIQANLSEIPSLTIIQHSGLRDLIDHLLVKNPQQRLTGATLAWNC
jgi:serine/threonine protein kinase